MLRSVLACGGFSTKVTSVCQWLARPSSLSTGSTLGAPGTAGTAGGFTAAVTSVCQPLK
jgi:hypothetical protein